MSWTAWKTSASGLPLNIWTGSESMPGHLSLEKANQILARVNGLNRLDQVLDLVIEEIASDAGFDGCLINLADENRQALYCHKLILPDPLRHLEKTYTGYKFSLNSGDLNSRCFTQNESLWAGRQAIREIHELTKERIYAWDINALAAIPIENQGKVMGTVMLFYLERDPAPEIFAPIQEKLGWLSGAIRRTLELFRQAEDVRQMLALKQKADRLISLISTTNRLYSFKDIFDILLKELIKTFGFNSGLIWMAEDGRLRLKASVASDALHEKTLEGFNAFFRQDGLSILPPDSVIAIAFAKNEHLFVSDAMKIMHLPMFEKDKESLEILKTPRTSLHIPIQYDDQPIGMVTLGSLEEPIEVEAAHIRLMKSVCAVIGTTLKNSELYTQVEAQKKEIEEFNLHLEKKVQEQTVEIRMHLEEKTELLNACDRFVPHEFLDLLERRSIKDIRMGDHVRKNISVFFTDIRSFTLLSEMMTPEENFRFLNSYLRMMGPIFRKHNGFIDKFIGDAIMALFLDADEAVMSGIELRNQLEVFNLRRESQGFRPIKIGIGINTGDLMLGTIGEHDRMETTVIGDTVNLASRIEGLTKEFQYPFLISENTYHQLKRPSLYDIQWIGQVTVRGKTKEVAVYRVGGS
jgi:class 3 adenylate cyclase